MGKKTRLDAEESVVSAEKGSERKRERRSESSGGSGAGGADGAAGQGKVREERTNEDNDDEENSKPKAKAPKISAHPHSIERSALSKPSAEALRRKHVESLFPIQSQTLHLSLRQSDLIGRAATGQGKTLAFGLPLVEHVSASTNSNSRSLPKTRGSPLGLVVTPTRELAKQVHTELEDLSHAHKLRMLSVYGGAQYKPQQDALKAGVDVVIGTPGRIKDFMSPERNELTMASVCVRVLDEADRMLDMGFREDIEEILSGASSQQVQTLLFSATLPKWVSNIANRFLKPDYTTIDLVNGSGFSDTDNKAAALIDHILLPCQWNERAGLIADVIRKYATSGKTVVFAETKRDVSEVTEAVSEKIDGGVRELHGDLSQPVREQVLAAFRREDDDPKSFRCLVATDVAARGLDINSINLIVQCEPPREADTYIHRAGRTARAGSSGTSVLLCTKRNESAALEIERKCGIKFRRDPPPQQTDLAAGAVDHAAQSLHGVQHRAAALFKEKAESLLSNGETASTLLSKALACIAGFSTLTDRSLLSSHQGAATLLLRVKSEIRGPGFVFSLLKRRIREDVVETIKRMSLLEDRSGAVFDVPSESVHLFMNVEQDDHFSLQLATEIPPLAAKPNNSSSNNDNHHQQQQSHQRGRENGRSGGRNYQQNGRGGRGGRGRGR